MKGRLDDQARAVALGCSRSFIQAALTLGHTCPSRGRPRPGTQVQTWVWPVLATSRSVRVPFSQRVAHPTGYPRGSLRPLRG